MAVVKRHPGQSVLEIAEAEGYRVVEFRDMPSGLEEVRVTKVVFVPCGLSPLGIAWRVAHAMGHSLHSGNHLWLYSQRYDFLGQREEEADIYAVALMTGSPYLRRWMADQLIALGDKEGDMFSL